ALHQREETEVKQTIEVEVGPEDDAGTCLVVLGGTRHERWDRDTVLGFGLTIPESEPEPPLPPEPRAEYALYRFNENGSIVTADEVLVAAHSVRVGDRIEWAPGDWREITQVEDHRFAITLWFDYQPFSLNRWDLVAVRR